MSEFSTEGEICSYCGYDTVPREPVYDDTVPRETVEFPGTSIVDTGNFPISRTIKEHYQKDCPVVSSCDICEKFCLASNLFREVISYDGGLSLPFIRLVCPDCTNATKYQ